MADRRALKAAGQKGEFRAMLMVKEPGARVACTVDWSRAWPEGPGVAAAAWHVEPGAEDPDPLTVEPGAADWRLARATLTGGTAGRDYGVVCTATLADGQVDALRIRVRVDAR